MSRFHPFCLKSIGLACSLALSSLSAAAGPLAPQIEAMLAGMQGQQPGNAFASSFASSFASMSGSLAADSRVACAADLAEAGNGRKLWAIYIIGTDLESGFSGYAVDANNAYVVPLTPLPPKEAGGNAATVNLLQLVEGYQSLSAEEQANIDVVVGFGGAYKEGWKGIRYADLKTLVEDAKDLRFGNLPDGSYAFVDENANLGDQATFKSFLDYAKRKYGQDSLRFLSFWGHGGVYSENPGLGQDDWYLTNGSDAATLDLVKMNNALAESRTCWHMVGFDSCQLSSLQTATAFKNYANLMIGSEENSPGHGWNYSPAIRALAREPDALGFGKALAESFLDSTTHAYVEPSKTESIVDLSKIDALNAAVSGAGTALTKRIAGGQGSAVVLANRFAQSFYDLSSLKGIGRASMDLIDFLSLAKERGATDATVDAAIAAGKEAVLYARNDGSHPYAYGVSIAGLELADGSRAVSLDTGLLPSGWSGLIQAYAGMKANPAAAASPVIDQVHSVYPFVAGSTAESPRSGEPGTSYSNYLFQRVGIAARVASPYLSGVSSLLVGRLADGRQVALGSDLAWGLGGGTWFAERWPQKYWMVSNGLAGQEARYAAIPAFFAIWSDQEGVSPSHQALVKYQALAKVERKAAGAEQAESYQGILEIEKNMVTGDVMGSSIYKLDGDGTVVPSSKLALGGIGENDVLTLTFQGQSLDGSGAAPVDLATISLNANSKVTYDTWNASLLQPASIVGQALQATSLGGGMALTEVQPASSFDQALDWAELKAAEETGANAVYQPVLGNGGYPQRSQWFSGWYGRCYARYCLYFDDSKAANPDGQTGLLVNIQNGQSWTFNPTPFIAEARAAGY